MTQNKIELNKKAKQIDMSKWSRLNVHDENLTEPLQLNRRSALKMMGASAALAVGIPGCKRKPKRHIISRIDMPEYQKPGKSIFYASTWTDGDYPYGLLIKTVDGRPIKIEGNPDHPVNGGKTSSQMQASILSLYDPDRLQAPGHGKKGISWKKADTQIIDALKTAGKAVLLTKSTLGPAERKVIAALQKASPAIKHFAYESINDAPRRAAWTKMFGEDGEWIPQFDKAKIIVSIESDFLGNDGIVLENNKLYAQTRTGGDDQSRCYVVESNMTITGSVADHRIKIKPSETLQFVQSLRKAIASKGDATGATGALIADLKANRGKGIVVAGGHLPQSVHAAVALLNQEIKAFNNTLVWNNQPATVQTTSNEEITKTLLQGVDVLICLGVNPVYDFAGGDFITLLNKAKLSVAHGLYANETVAASTLKLASSHNLESWNDAIARNGVESLCQPVIAELYSGPLKEGTRQEAASLLTWTQGITGDHAYADWHDYVHRGWMTRHHSNAINATTAWHKDLRLGLIVSENKANKPTLNTSAANTLANTALKLSGSGEFELVIMPSYALGDGRFSNLSWLQESPDPVTRQVWDNAALMSLPTATKLGARDAVSDSRAQQLDYKNDMVTINVEGKQITLPILVVNGIENDVVIVTAGYGRSAAGTIGNVQEESKFKRGGFSTTAVMALGRVVNAKIAKANGSYDVVRTQTFYRLDDRYGIKAIAVDQDDAKLAHNHTRPIALDSTVEDMKHPERYWHQTRHIPPQVDIYAEHDYSKGPRWAMSIDMTKCVGCTACHVACQAENNIPIVGKDECSNGREMSWIRIDRYETGENNSAIEDNPTIHSQPLPCQHCENAPCENVCPVSATSHSVDGINEMVYNRCIGTRYCANNCPYKVRRFNFYDYSERANTSVIGELKNNPQVTVRSRGVMEKCTFCVQRTTAAKHNAKNKGVEIKDGDFEVACQQACPASAIEFGNINDKTSKVAKLHSDRRKYFVLEELNVKPAVAYQVRVKNPHPTLVKATPVHNDDHGGHH